MTEWVDVAGEQEIERLDLIGVAFSFIEILKGSHYGRAADSYATNGWQMLEFCLFCRQTQDFPNNIQPHLCDPFAIFALRVAWVQQMAKAVFGPAILVIVHTVSKQHRNALFIFEK